MQNVAFDAFAIFSRENGIIVVEFHNLVWPFEFCGQLAIFIEEVMDTH